MAEFKTPKNRLLFLICFLWLAVSCNPTQVNETKIFKCGQRNKEGLISNPTAPLIGESNFGEFPWTIDISKDNKVFCVGSLIHPKVVLSAAQCFLRQPHKELIKLRAGIWDREDNNERYPYQERSIEKTITHPAEDPRQYSYDIALVIVNEPFIVADHINTICLPPANYETPNGTISYATGWGRKLLFGEYIHTSERMKRVTLTTLNMEICERELNTQLHRTAMCAVGLNGLNGIDTCLGDGGGPLVSRIKEDEEIYHQIGITSFGRTCFSGIPGGYTNVAYLREWIDSQMKENGLEISTYLHE
ncbi:phenoloxidase-activating factor 2-like [Musca autumnalis]|uniref:phenoloxidase-activating factor 2-like n=1 Tax=Musca autumnalis TaxID=221902 RepID=UPI003CE6ADAD